MRHINRFIGIGIVYAMTMLPLPSFGESTYNCPGVKQTCGDWGKDGTKTCRTCQQAQCKKENDKDVLAGNKTTKECYEGHGSPPN